MTFKFILAVCAMLTACPPPPGPVPPPQPDATDAAQALEAAPPVPMTPCQSACSLLDHLCGPQQADCVRVMAHIESAREIRKPNDGNALTCTDVASATTVAAVRALGVACVGR
jgi:hypothetical protein